MPDDTKAPAPPPEGGPKPAAETPVPSGATGSHSPAPPATPPVAAAEKPAAAAAPKPPAPAKPAGPVPVAWESALVAKLKGQFGSGVEALTYLGQNYLQVDRSLIPNILQILRDEEQFDYCVDVTAVHYPKRERQFDVLWILYSFARNERVRVKTQIADGGAYSFSGLHLADRQLAGARGLRYVRDTVRRSPRTEAHPPSRWMEGPSAAQGLRHHRAGLRVGADQPRDRKRPMTDSTSSVSHLDLDESKKTFLDANELILNMGPQHPATHGVLRVILRLDGEKVLGLECVIGYLHRGVEKIAEHRTYTMFNPYVDRMDYVAAVSNGLGYCEAVEKLLNIEAPPRANYIRVILTELNRLASHQLWLGTHALDIGAMTPLFYTFRDREEILKIFEKYCGARLTTHAFRIGGCQYETYEGFEKDVKKFVAFRYSQDRRI